MVAAVALTVAALYALTSIAPSSSFATTPPATEPAPASVAVDFTFRIVVFFTRATTPPATARLPPRVRVPSTVTQEITEFSALPARIPMFASGFAFATPVATTVRLRTVAFFSVEKRPTSARSESMFSPLMVWN